MERRKEIYMREKFNLILSLCLFTALLGCGAVQAPTPAAALAPGALNQFDSDTYRSLASAHALAQSAASNASTLTQAEKTALNQLIRYLNAADTLYEAYHAGAASQSSMQTALNDVDSSEASYTATITGAK
jgi:hypothetical protein